MKLIFISFLIYSCFFLLPNLVLAVPSPEQVDEAKANAEVVVIGKVQERRVSGDAGTFKLLVNEVERSSDDVKIGDLLTVDFFYIPQGQVETGSSAVRVADGDVIRIWLNLRDNGNYRSSLAGDTIDYINNNLINKIFVSVNERIRNFFQFITQRLNRN